MVLYDSPIALSSVTRYGFFNGQTLSLAKKPSHVTKENGAIFIVPLSREPHFMGCTNFVFIICFGFVCSSVNADNKPDAVDNVYLG